MKKKHVGSKFDDFLAEEGFLEEAESVAAKRVFVFQIEKEMKKQKIDKSEFAVMLETICCIWKCFTSCYKSYIVIYFISILFCANIV